MNREEAARKNLEGQKLLEAEQYDEAIKLFSEAIEIDTNYAAPWLNRSDANRKLGREAEANADKEKGESLLQAARTGVAQQRTAFSGRTVIEEAQQRMIFGGRTLRGRTLRGRLITVDEVIIDKVAQSIMVRKPRFWFIPSKRVIPFSTVIGVNAVFHPADQLSESRWEVRINFRGEKYMETIEIARAKQEEPMHHLASEIESFIGLYRGR